ncbi:hypothetical protein RDV84_13625 [Lysobacter yananisis]|uniref:DUF3619 family protein n=1 Tax=Lysobacter yananisis TaxID=1003114 RepID=A0ABY9P252_9GAMM|nr:hypothetical protein [Lysobacter yananisis]WMT01049.1 hypothetical protein RDV84_13625 [Lysobacter yananisis]
MNTDPRSADGRTPAPHRASPADEADARFDATLRDLHAQSLERLSPQVRQRLRTIRSEAAAQPRRGRGGLLGWTLASSGVAAVALALGLQFAGGGAPLPAAAPAQVAQQPVMAAPSAVAAEASYDPDTAVAALDENPDLYLWLASNTDALPQTHLE